MFFFQPEGVDWEDQLRNLKQEVDTVDYSAADKPGVR